METAEQLSTEDVRSQRLQGGDGVRGHGGRAGRPRRSPSGILIQFHKVTITTSSHDKGGITDRDLRLARQIEAAAKDQMA